MAKKRQHITEIEATKAILKLYPDKGLDPIEIEACFCQHRDSELISLRGKIKELSALLNRCAKATPAGGDLHREIGLALANVEVRDEHQSDAASTYRKE